MGFCVDTTPTCDICHEVLYGNCNDTLTIVLGLNPNTNYFLNLIDKYDTTTPIDVTTDGAGKFTLTQTWTEFFGAIEVDIFSDSARTIKVSFVIGGTEFNCLILKT